MLSWQLQGLHTRSKNFWSCRSIIIGRKWSRESLHLEGRAKGLQVTHHGRWYSNAQTFCSDRAVLICNVWMMDLRWFSSVMSWSPAIFPRMWNHERIVQNRYQNEDMDIWDCQNSNYRWEEPWKKSYIIVAQYYTLKMRWRQILWTGNEELRVTINYEAKSDFVLLQILKYFAWIKFMRYIIKSARLSTFALLRQRPMHLFIIRRKKNMDISGFHV